jgi:hypothetical protein
VGFETDGGGAIYGNYKRTGGPMPQPAFFWSGCWQSHRRHRLMTYALIASKMATLIAIMIKKNFPIALPPADPNAKQQE